MKKPRSKDCLSTVRIVWDTKSRKIYEPKNLDTKIIEVVAAHLMAVSTHLGFKK